MGWYDEVRKVSYRLDGREASFTMGSDICLLGQNRYLRIDVPPLIRGGRTYVPVRFVAEGLGLKVTPSYNVDGTTAAVSISKTDQAPAPVTMSEIEMHSSQENALFLALENQSFTLTGGDRKRKCVLHFGPSGYFDGEDYDVSDGTIRSSFNGHFLMVRQLNAYTYMLELDTLNWALSDEQQADSSGENVTYTSPFIINGGASLAVQLPGTPEEYLGEGAGDWYRAALGKPIAFPTDRWILNVEAMNAEDDLIRQSYIGDNTYFEPVKLIW